MKILKNPYRKLISIFIVIIAMTTFSLPISAEEAVEYDTNEIKTLTREAFDMYIHLYRASFESGSMDEKNCIPGKDLYCSCGFDYWRRADKYAKWDDLEAEVYSHFTKAAGDRFIKYMHSFEHDGYTYTSMHVAMPQDEGVYIDGYYMEGEKSVPVSFDNSFNVISVEGNVLTASFAVVTDPWIYGDDAGSRPFTLEYTKTSDGWRISGGSFVNTFFNVKSAFVSPATGTDTVPILCLAAASALLVSRVKRRFAR